MTEISIKRLSSNNQKKFPNSFPLIYGYCSEKKDLTDLNHWLEFKRDDLLSDLEEHGAILFRGFPIISDEGFDQFIQAFKLKNLPYKDTFSNAVRYNRTDRVFTASEAPSTLSIFLHHELAQTTVYPSYLFFYCEKASRVGGETPLCRSDILFHQLVMEVPEFIDSCEKLGLRYTNLMPDKINQESGQGRNWRSTLGVTDRLSAEELLSDLNYHWEWKKDGALSVTTSVLPAVRKLSGGRSVFFNQLIAAYRGWEFNQEGKDSPVCFGDGTKISNRDMDIVIRLADQLSYDLIWEQGDIAIINNFLVMHGRKPYQGKRSILASLAVGSNY